MFNYQISFGSPGYLALLAAVPLLWWYSFRRLASLGRVRRLVAIALRSIVLVLVVMALADVQMVRTSDRLTVIYLLDRSASIPPQRAKAMLDYLNAAIKEHRQQRDRVGVIVFGREAAIELPPFDDDVVVQAIESPLDPEYTNPAGAMKLAAACFREDTAKRIVLVSDGNQNIGDAAEQAQRLAGAGIGIDVLPVRHQARSEIIVERVTIPGEVRQGEPFDLKVVVTNTARPTAGDTGQVRGRLKLSQTAGGKPQLVSDEPVVLKPGKNVFPVTQQIDAANFYTYEARFEPEDPADDAMRQNNRATAFTHVRGSGQVLLVENYDPQHGGEFDQLVERLRRQRLEVTVQPSDQLFSTPADLLPYDTVVLADVPREHFTEEQIRILVGNTQQMGAGLVMLGGPNSFGAGGWTNTELEKAMPVDFQIDDAKVIPVGALMLVVDHSGSMAGEKLELCKAAAIASAKALSSKDYIGVVAFDSAADWVVRITRVTSLQAIAGRIARLGAGGGTDMRPGILEGYHALQGVDASLKHMIVLTDGQTMGEGYQELAARIRRENITISTVAVGPDADVPLLVAIAGAGGGKFYRANNPKALPRIFIKEARRVARPLIFDKYPVQPHVKFPHEMVQGIQDPLPPIKGFVLSTKKDNPLVEVSLVSPQPAGERNSTILASWTYGLGRAVAFTSDGGARWTDDWLRQDMYDRLFGQVVRWSMRPSSGATKNFTVATELKDQQVCLVITALDKDDEFLNFLSMSGSAVGPGLEPIPIQIEQTAPGRYLGSFPASRAGSYFIVVSPGVKDAAPILTGVNVPYSDEFRERDTNESLLGELAGMVPAGGRAGEVIGAKQDRRPAEPLLAVNSFRHGGLAKATSSQDVWFYVVLVGGCLFFFDVLFRRVQVSLGWVGPLLARARDAILGRRPRAAAVATMERLRSRKVEVAGRIEQLRAEARFEAPPEAAGQLSEVEELPGPKPGRPAAPSLSTQQEAEEEGYTERLLRAKREVWDDRRKND